MDGENNALATGIQYTYDDLIKMSDAPLLLIFRQLQIEMSQINDRDDMAQRIILAQKKAQRTSHTPFDKFSEVKSDTDEKCSSLKDNLEKLYRTFSNISTGPLSDVLRNEGLLKHQDLLDEILARIRVLEARESLVIIAGETNGGKSTFLNLILGEKILPTDAIHCTLGVTKIKYSDTYSIETVDHSGTRTSYNCEGSIDVLPLLKKLVAEEDQMTRLQGSKYREITLKMPAAILKSGMTLVDTPGIGEMSQMDDVTMNYIKSTRAAAFIYIIKSDTAGGVQEDRLVSFLRAIQEDYKRNDVDNAIDPRAALFICNRWDHIHEKEEEIVKLNALTKLDIVWPGFKPEQVHFFSSRKAQLHIDTDPEFITDKLNEVLLGMNNLFKRVAHNNVQHQYRWTKVFLQQSSRHLGPMINHCIRSNEELEDFFRTVAGKQEILMKKSSENTSGLQDALVSYKERLQQDIHNILSNVTAENLENYDQLVTIITPDLIADSKTKGEMDQWIINGLIHHCAKIIHQENILGKLENEAKSLIEKHVGLHKEQIHEITAMVQGEVQPKGGISRRPQSMLLEAYGSSIDSSGSSSGRSSVYEIFENTTMDPTLLDQAVDSFFVKRKKSKGVLTLGPNVKRKMMVAFQAAKTKTLGGSGGKSREDIPAYVSRRIQKNAIAMRESHEIVEGLVVGYLHVIQTYISSAIEHIPHFITVNNKLMDNIRDHRRLLKEDKDSMVTVMDELERHRDHMRGYGLLFMDDLHADSIDFNTNRRVIINDKALSVSARLDDSGFIDSGSSRNKGRGFWTQTRNALIKEDGEPVDVTLKTYTSEIDKNLQFSEIASLRYLDHSSLAPFFGMTRVCNNSEGASLSEKLTAFIFKGSLVSARIFRRNPLIVEQDFVVGFVTELISGLEYLHRENMVHLELNLDTVMVDFQTGKVQLCQQCKPREIQLPSDLSIMTKSSICLSPIVLEGNEYCIADDIYAFAILLWELLFPENLPYAEQRLWPLAEFIEKVCPTKMLGPQINHLDASDAVIRVFTEALLTDRQSRCLTARDIRRHLWKDDLYGLKKLLQDFSNDKNVRKIAPARRQVIKRQSRDKLFSHDIPKDQLLESVTNRSELSRPASATDKCDDPGPPPVRPPRQRDEKKRRSSLPNVFSPSVGPQIQLESSVSEFRNRLLESAEADTLSHISNSVTRTSQERMKKFSVPCVKINDQSELQTMYEDDILSTIPTEGGSYETASSSRGVNSRRSPPHGGPRERRRSVTKINASDQLKLQETYEAIQCCKQSVDAHLNDAVDGERMGVRKPSPRAQAGRRQWSVPSMTASDQKKLQDTHRDIESSKPARETYLNSSFEEQVSDISLSIKGRRRDRQRSVPNIDFSDQQKLQELADSIENDRKKSKWWKLITKPRMKRQQHVQEGNIVLNNGQRSNTMYGSVPGNLNTLPGTRLDPQKPCLYSRMVDKLNTQKSSNDHRNLPPSTFTSGTVGRPQTLLKLGEEQRMKWRSSKKSLSDEGPQRPLRSSLGNLSAPCSPSSHFRNRGSVTESSSPRRTRKLDSPTFTHRWSQVSLKSNSSVEDETAVKSENNTTHPERSKSNSSLYSMYISSILADRSRFSDSSKIDFDGTFIGSSLGRSTQRFSTRSIEEIQGKLQTPDISAPVLSGDMSPSNALPNFSGTGSSLSLDECHSNSIKPVTNNESACSTTSYSSSHFENTFDTSSALPSLSKRLDGSRSAGALPTFDDMGVMDNDLSAFASLDECENDLNLSPSHAFLSNSQNNNNDSIKMDFRSSNPFPSLDNIEVSGYSSSSEVDNDNNNILRSSSKHVTFDIPESDLPDALPPLSLEDVRFLD